MKPDKYKIRIGYLRVEHSSKNAITSPPSIMVGHNHVEAQH